MSYKGRTRFYKIPYITKGLVLSESNLKLKMNIIDNLLYLSNIFYYNCVVLLGDYVLEETEDKLFLNLKIKVKNRFSLFVIYDGMIYFSKELLNFRLMDNKHYYLYFRVLELNHDNKFLLFLTNKKLTTSLMLLCTIELRDNKRIIQYKDKKLYFDNGKKHAFSQLNPHGNVLKQDCLLTNRIILNNKPLLDTIYQLINVTNNKFILKKKDVEFINIMPIDDIGNYNIKINGDIIYIFTERNGKCKLLLKVR